MATTSQSEIDFSTSQWNVTMPDFYRYGYCVGILLVLYGIFDLAFAHRTKARYFAIHVLANSIVVVTSAPGLWFTISSPAEAIRSTDFSYWAFSANMAIHIYHVVAFNNLTWLDWLHHGIMTGLFTPLGLMHDNLFGPIVDVNNFFACGLPGGLDYALLFSVKQGYIAPIVEKRWNTVLNVWVRSPGILLSVFYAWACVFTKNPTATTFHPARLLELSIAVMGVWNAQYFMERVVGNYHVRLDQMKAKAKQNGQ